jgi:hypothetical protein
MPEESALAMIFRDCGIKEAMVRAMVMLLKRVSHVILPSLGCGIETDTLKRILASML